MELLEFWCPGAESNRRHKDFQSFALPTELPGLCNIIIFVWCPGAESNRRHKDFQSFALPTELPGQAYKRRALDSIIKFESRADINFVRHNIENGEKQV